MRERGVIRKAHYIERMGYFYIPQSINVANVEVDPTSLEMSNILVQIGLTIEQNHKLKALIFESWSKLLGIVAEIMREIDKLVKGRSKSIAEKLGLPLILQKIEHYRNMLRQGKMNIEELNEDMKALSKTLNQLCIKRVITCSSSSY